MHGDIFATIDADGKVLSTHQTGPFGEKLPNQTTPWNTLSGGTMNYVGAALKLTEAQLALQPIQMGARVYIPALGRFLQVDPVQGGTPNNYVYPPEPVNGYDLTGQFWSILLRVLAPALTREGVKQGTKQAIKTTVKSTASKAAQNATSPVLQVSKSVNKTNISVTQATKVPNITVKYSRPTNATTPAQRTSVQGQTCVTCGIQGPRMYADHITPLVREYYQTGAINTVRMRSIPSVQPQCPQCSNIQGGGG